MNNAFKRSKELIGEACYDLINKSKILLIGVGGVGGTCLEALIRSGFSNITIVDDDIIEETNLNRQVITNINNLNKNKVDEAYNFALSINPNANIKKIKLFVNKDNINNLFNDKYDYVIDCIDNIFSKLDIYKACLERNIKIVSSMGSALKIDPTKLIVTTLNKTNNDPLERKMRRLCKENDIDSSKIIVVYSTENSFINGSSNSLPSMMMVPSAFGLALSYFVINDLLKSDI